MNILKHFAIFLLVLTYTGSPIHATPYSMFWTVCTTDVVETGMGYINNDNFFTVLDRHGPEPIINPDFGFEIGAYSWKDWQMEAGIDYFGGADDPLFFNAGIAIAEGKLSKTAPAIKIGIFGIGTRLRGKSRTNLNIVDLIFGKTVPEPIGGKFYVGVYSGSRAIGVRQGVMCAYEKNFCPATDCHGEDYFKWIFCADYSSGNNYVGGGGVGLCYSFTPNFIILAGPVWTISEKFNGDWKWSVQITYNFPVFKPNNTKQKAEK